MACTKCCRLIRRSFSLSLNGRLLTRVANLPNDLASRASASQAAIAVQPASA
jgi:hypothetical protein